MDNETIKIALSYSLGSDIHESWRALRKLKDGTFEPRIKKTKDEYWVLKHGSKEVDIANLSFKELPSDWQYENFEAAKVAIGLVYDKIVAGENITEKEIESMSSIIHEEWLKRNTWVYDPNYGDSKLTVPFSELSKEEQEKDRAQLLPAIDKVKLYVKGGLNIEEICSQYNIPHKGKGR